MILPLPLPSCIKKGAGCFSAFSQMKMSKLDLYLEVWFSFSNFVQYMLNLQSQTYFCFLKSSTLIILQQFCDIITSLLCRIMSLYDPVLVKSLRKRKNAAETSANMNK